MLYAILILLFITTLKVFKMSNELQDVKETVEEALAIAKKVAADVDNLHAKIDAIEDQPTPEQWAEVKEIAGKLKQSLVETDAKTEDAEAPVTDSTTTDAPVEEPATDVPAETATDETAETQQP